MVAEPIDRKKANGIRSTISGLQFQACSHPTSYLVTFQSQKKKSLFVALLMDLLRHGVAHSRP